jgi:hypothetical protein
MPAPSARRPRPSSKSWTRVWWRLDRALDAHPAARRGAVLRRPRAPRGHDGARRPPRVAALHRGLARRARRRLRGARGARAALLRRHRAQRRPRRGPPRPRRVRALHPRQPPRDLVRGAVGLHASFTVSDATVRDAARLARALGAPSTSTSPRTIADVEDARARGHAGPPRAPPRRRRAPARLHPRAPRRPQPVAGALVQRQGRQPGRRARPRRAAVLAHRRREPDHRRVRRPVPDDHRAQGAGRLRLPRPARRHRPVRPHPPPRDLALTGNYARGGIAISRIMAAAASPSCPRA